MLVFVLVLPRGACKCHGIRVVLLMALAFEIAFLLMMMLALVFACLCVFWLPFVCLRQRLLLRWCWCWSWCWSWCWICWGRRLLFVCVFETTFVAVGVLAALASAFVWMCVHVGAGVGGGVCV